MRKYFLSREFFITLGLLIAGTLGLAFFIFYAFLPFYTKHGQSVRVPEVHKLDYKQAIKTLENAGLEAEVRDSIYMPNLPVLSVVKQYPVHLSTVKPGRTIFLTLNKVVPPSVKMPKVVDLKIFQAKAKLESWKLLVKETRSIPDIAKDVVLKVLLDGKEIKEGTLIPQGTGLTLIVGEGLKDEFAHVPDVSNCMSYDEALNILQQSGFTLGAVIYNPVGKCNGRIYDQYPQAEGDSVKTGWPVDIFVDGVESEGGSEIPMEEGQKAGE